MTAAAPPLLLPVAEAQARIIALARQLAARQIAVERLPLSNVAGLAGHWLAEDLLAQRTQPAADLSSMDGYAIRFADMPGPWRLTGESAAGRAFDGKVNTGEAVRIFTGAAMPTGAETVLVQEDAQADDGAIHLTGDGPTRAGAHVRPAGMDFRAGEVLLPAGTRFSPAALALAAMGGHSALPVRRRVRVAMAATGDELIDPGATAAPDRLPETNRLMLAAMLAGLPVEIIDLGILPDDLTATTYAFRQADADIIVTSGGASVGDHDLVRPALLAAGGTIDFWRIAMRPGKPLLMGTLPVTGGTTTAMVIGLPGNPVSAFVTATLFLKTAIAAMSGAANPLHRRLTMPLGAPLPANDAREDFLRATIRDGAVFAADRQDSSLLRVLAQADCLIVRPAHAKQGNIGDSAEVLVIE